VERAARAAHHPLLDWIRTRADDGFQRSSGAKAPIINPVPPIRIDPSVVRKGGREWAGSTFFQAMSRYAILLDGGFVTKRLHRKLGRFPAATDVLSECDRIGGSSCLVGHDRLRILFYDAPPADRRVTNPLDGRSTDLAQTPQFTRSQALHDALELLPDVALRLGELAVRGWQVDSRTVRQLARAPRQLVAADLRLVIEQKGVDLRIGLDIARLALRRHVDEIVIVSADSDLVPALRFARREGLRVYLDTLGAKAVVRDLIAHADRVL
jgi:uncharacterized LabA/DUF88 family protein